MDGVPAVTNNSTVANAVLAGWSLTPTGLAVGDQFRLLFLSSTKRDAAATDIATYNTFIQTRAAAGHTDIQAYSAGFRVVGCTAATDARDNTETTYISTAKGVPIYWLNGAKAADEYEDFYDGTWDDEANDKNESGTDAHDTSQTANYPWTGCNHNGTEFRQFAGTVSRGLGSNNDVRYGRPDSSTVDHGPLNGLQNGPKAENRPLYGLSALFQVVGEDTTPPTLTSADVEITDALIIDLDVLRGPAVVQPARSFRLHCHCGRQCRYGLQRPCAGERTATEPALAPTFGLPSANARPSSSPTPTPRAATTPPPSRTPPATTPPPSPPAWTASPPSPTTPPSPRLSPRTGASSPPA